MSFVFIRLSFAAIAAGSIGLRQCPMAKAMTIHAISPNAHANCGENFRAAWLGTSLRLRRATIRRGNISRDSPGISGSRIFFKMESSSGWFMGQVFQQAFQFLARGENAPRNGGFRAA